MPPKDNKAFIRQGDLLTARLASEELRTQAWAHDWLSFGVDLESRMSKVTQFGLHDRPLGSFRYRTMPQILADEQLAFAARMRARNHHLAAQDLRATSVEERMGAALLRSMLSRTDVIIEDAEATVLRVVVPKRMMDELELWGSDNEDAECNRDVEGWDYQTV